MKHGLQLENSDIILVQKFSLATAHLRTLQRIVARVPNMQWARMLLYMRHRLIISILTGRGSVFTHLAQPIGCLILEKIRQTIFEEDPTLRITIFLYTNHLGRDGKTLYICFRLWSIVDLNISNLRCHIVVS